MKYLVEILKTEEFDGKEYTSVIDSFCFFSLKSAIEFIHIDKFNYALDSSIKIELYSLNKMSLGEEVSKSGN